MKNISNNATLSIARILFWLLVLAGAITIFFGLIFRLSIATQAVATQAVATSTNLTLTLPRSVISYGELIFEEEFDIPSDDWDIVDNRLDSGGLFVSSKNDFVPFGSSPDDPPIFTDFIFESQFSFLKDSTQIDFMVRSQYPPCAGWNCSIDIVIDRTVNNIVSYQWEYGEHGQPTSIVTFNPESIHLLPDQWNRITIIANGNDYKVYINDFYVTGFKDDKYKMGTYIIYNASPSEIKLDYIRVYDLPR